MTPTDPTQTGSERRLLAALLLSTVVLLGTPYFFEYFYPAPEIPEVLPQEIAALQAPPPPVVTEQEEPETDTIPTAATNAPRDDFQVVGADLILDWTSHGAFVVGAQLPGYLSEVGEPLQLVPQGLPDSFRRPLQFGLSDEILEQEIRNAAFEVERSPGRRINAPTELVFRYRSQRLDVERRVSIPPNGFTFSVSDRVRVDGREVPHRLAVGSGIGVISTATIGDFGFQAIAYSADGSVTRYDAGDLADPAAIETSAEWVALDSHYFSTTLLADTIESIRMRQDSWTRGEGDTAEQLQPLTAEVVVPSVVSYTAFFGPKELQVLQAVSPTLPDLVDYGWFAILVKPLLFLLKSIYSLIGNYGFAIIILTFLINMALLPIRYKQIISMRKMSELQPKLKEIQDRYKKFARDDPKKQDMNKEVMALYQQHGVNPLGGCLPLLVQMPFLFAFYRMLASSIELRGAPFIFWIEDLSKHDPTYITPVVMGATMLFQQKITPATGDPTQRRIMMLMPIMFTGFFLWVSSGLALYFLFSNIFGILFQLGIQRFNPSEEQPQSSKPKRAPRGKKSR